jgi:hypothetical protein
MTRLARALTLAFGVAMGIVASGGLAEAQPRLYVTSQKSQNVLVYDGTTGSYIGPLFASGSGGLNDPLDVVIAPDGNVLVSSAITGQVLRYDRISGAFLGVFASVQEPIGMTIHAGELYVTSQSNTVERFDATTGVHTGTFPMSTVNSQPRSVKVNPANDRLYVLGYNNASVELFDVDTTASLGYLLAPSDTSRSDGLRTPQDMAFGPDGLLYIGGGTTGAIGIRRYDAITGAFIDFFAATEGLDPLSYYPMGLAFGPDGNLYVAAQNGGAVMRFDHATGAFIDFFVANGDSPLISPFHMSFALDTTPPVITPSVAGTLGLNGWYTSNVFVSFTVADAESVVSSTVGCDATTISADTIGTTSSCQATSDGGTSSESVTIRRDATAPSLTVSDLSAIATSPAGALISSYSVSASDALDPSPTVACLPVAPHIFPIGDSSVACTASDQAGNARNASFTVHVDGAAQQLANLLSLVTGIGSGQSLVAKVLAAQEALAAHDTASACNSLGALINQAGAQSGKSLAAAQADAIIAAATQIRTLFGC